MFQGQGKEDKSAYSRYWLLFLFTELILLFFIPKLKNKNINKFYIFFFGNMESKRSKTETILSQQLGEEQAPLEDPSKCVV